MVSSNQKEKESPSPIGLTKLPKYLVCHTNVLYYMYNYIHTLLNGHSSILQLNVWAFSQYCTYTIHIYGNTNKSMLQNT